MYVRKTEVIRMNSEEQLKKFLKNNHGYVTTNELLKLGINKSSIHNFIDNKIIEKVNHGLYIDSTNMVDEYYILQKKYPLVVFSYNTALYILNLTNRTPSVIDITVPRKKAVRGAYNIHWVSDKYYNIGIIDVVSSFGNPIKIYNAERCICDMLKSNDEFDLELKNRILDYYWNSKNKNIDLLLEYAKIFNIYDKVNTIVEVMMKW